MAECGVLTEEEWLSVVQKVLGATDCEVLGVSVADLGRDLDGYLASHLQAKVSVLVHDSSSPTEKVLYFFVKRIPREDQKKLELVQSIGVFPKETGLYSTVFPSYPDSLTPWGPVCYYVNSDQIVLEDLTCQNFRLLGRRTCLNYSHCALLLRALAAFHAGSIIVQERLISQTGQSLEMNELYPQLLFENQLVDDSSLVSYQWFTACIGTLTSAVNLLRKYKTSIDVDKINLENFQKYFRQIYEFVKPSKKDRNVICHADLWSSNMLFKYEEGDDETPVDVRIVDFQLARYTPPALDVMLLLHLNSTRNFRKTNINELLSHYHKCLGEELARHGYGVEDLLPKKEFEDSCEFYYPASCIVTPCYHILHLVDEEVMK